MIAKLIYEGKSFEEIGISKINYLSRKETLDNFLEQWDGSNFEESYLVWLPSYNSDNNSSCAHCDSSSERTDINKENNDSEEVDLTYGEMFSDLAKSIKAIASSDIKIVDNNEHERRYLICKNCKYLQGKRCRRCGCFMKIKTKFKAVSCPIDKW